MSARSLPRVATTDTLAVPNALKPVREVLDVSAVPPYAFGHRTELWWGTVAFMLIEGMTLVLCAAAYLYLRRNFESWPPPPTPLPSLLLPTITVVVMLASLVPAYLMSRAAREMNLGGVRVWTLLLSLLQTAVMVLRWWDFRALNTRWDATAYGSASWATVGFHATLLVLSWGETLGWTALAFSGRVEGKHFPDFDENAFYWTFVVGSWVVLYVLLYLFPRWA